MLQRLVVPRRIFLYERIDVAPQVWWDSNIWLGVADDSGVLPSAANLGRLDESKAALELALASSELRGAPLLVAANKQDRDR